MLSAKSQQKVRYLVSGLIATGVDYGVYEVLALLVFTAENNLWIATLCSGIVAIVVAYFLHSRFTWKDRRVGKKELAKFFVWNAAMNVAIRPLLTMGFGLLGFLYQFAYDVFQGIGIGFSYEFVRSTGNYVLMTIVVMIANFLVYDKFVFGEKAKKRDDEENEAE